MAARTYKARGIVLKRRNFAEADRIITIFTRDHGKIVCIAKGVRKLKSRKKGSLEPGTMADFFFVRGKTWDILTQTQLIDSFAAARTNLTRLTQISQILEIVDLLTVEGQSQVEVFDGLRRSMSLLESNGTKKQKLLETIHYMLKVLGFASAQPLNELELKQFIENIVQRELRSKQYLTPPRGALK